MRGTFDSARLIFHLSPFIFHHYLEHSQQIVGSPIGREEYARSIEVEIDVAHDGRAVRRRIERTIGRLAAAAALQHDDVVREARTLQVHVVMGVETREAELVTADEAVVDATWFGDMSPHAQEAIGQHGIRQHRQTICLHSLDGTHGFGMRRIERPTAEECLAHRRLLRDQRLDGRRVLGVGVVLAALHVRQESLRRRRREHAHLLARSAHGAVLLSVAKTHRHHRHLVGGREAPDNLATAGNLKRRRARTVRRTVLERADNQVAVGQLLNAAQVLRVQAGKVVAGEAANEPSVARIFRNGRQVRDENVAVCARPDVKRQFPDVPDRHATPAACDRVELAHQPCAGTADEPVAVRRGAAHAIVVVEIGVDLAVRARRVALVSPNHPAVRRHLGEEVRSVFGDEQVAVLQHIEAIHAFAVGELLGMRLRRGVVDAFRRRTARFVHTPEASVGVEEAATGKEGAMDIAATNLFPDDSSVRAQQIHAALMSRERRHQQRRFEFTCQRARPVADRTKRRRGSRQRDCNACER